MCECEKNHGFGISSNEDILDFYWFLVVVVVVVNLGEIRISFFPWIEHIFRWVVQTLCVFNKVKLPRTFSKDQDVYHLFNICAKKVNIWIFMILRMVLDWSEWTKFDSNSFQMEAIMNLLFLSDSLFSVKKNPWLMQWYSGVTRAQISAMIHERLRFQLYPKYCIFEIKEFFVSQFQCNHYKMLNRAFRNFFSTKSSSKPIFISEMIYTNAGIFR